MIPFLYDDLQSLYKELIGLTIKPEVLGKCDDDYNELQKIDLLDVKNYMKKKDMHVAFGMQQELLSILKRDCVTRKDVNKFRIDAREFLVALLEKMFDKNPISFNIVTYASVLDPKVLQPQPLDLCKSLFQSLLFSLVHLKLKCSSQADLVLYEFPSFYHTSLIRERKTSFESFWKECDRLDDFYVKETNVCNYKILSSFFKLVLVH